MKRKIVDTLLDIYVESAIFFDTVFVICIFLANKYYPIVRYRSLSNEGISDYISNLIGTCVSLAGFLLAALTIIVTFKSNLKAKGVTEHAEIKKENALEYLLSTGHYKNIVNVFKTSIKEYIFIFIGLYATWFLLNQFSSSTTLNILICLTFTCVTSITRSLVVLFRILHLENVKAKITPSE